MFDIARDFDSKHELSSIDTCFVSLDHGNHALIILEKISGPFLPVRMLGQSFLDSIGDQWIRVLDQKEHQGESRHPPHQTKWL